MAKHILSIIFSLLLIGFMSCHEEKSTTNGQGYLYLGVEKNVTMQTKAVNPVLAVAILNAAEDTVKYIADYEAEKASEGILLDAGAYDVVVSSGKKDSAAFDLPYFYGETACEIKTNQVTSAKVTCKIANTKVTVDYSDDFKKYFTDYSTTISNSSGSLTFKKGETRGGFFAPEKLLAQLALTNTDGEQFELKREYEDIQERYHYKLYFKLSGDPDNPEDSGAGGKFDDITVDESADTVVVSIPIKVEDLENIKAPELTLVGFGENNNLEAKKGEFAGSSLKLVAMCGIDQLLVAVESDSLINRDGIPQTFDLANLDAGTRTKLENIHFPLPENIKGATGELTFDLTEMSKALASYDDKIQTHRFTFTVKDTKTQEQNVSFSYSVKPNVAVITKEIATMNIWSTFTFFSGESDSEEGFGFEYKKASDSEWTSVPASKNPGEKTFSAFIKGLDPKTEYVYRAFGNDQEGNKVDGNEIKFKTDYANEDDNGKPFVPNLSFDDWAKNGKSWYPNVSSFNIFWDSGNEGANSIREKNPTAPTAEVAVKGNGKQAALLETKVVMEVMAAGNIYTGDFVKAILSLSNPGALLDFGQKYGGGRPTKLTGYYKYKSVTINNAKKPYEDWKNKPDSCSIYIALCDWTESFRVDTQNKKFVNPNDPNIIAYGELSPQESGNGNMSAYKQFTIDIKYRDLKRKPTYILIVASASKYGDYFTGGEGSTLYIDEFELKYDYNPASFVGTSLEGLAE